MCMSLIIIIVSHHHPSYRVQNQVSNVIGIMKDNINRVMDRGEKLDSLEVKSG